MRFVLIALSVFLTLYVIPSVSLTLTYSDASLLFLIPLFLYDIIRKKIVINKYSKLILIYNAVLLLSSFTNLTTTQGAFLNIFKTSLISWVYFTWTYSLISRNNISKKIYIISIIALSIVFVAKTWTEMQASWAVAESGFIQINIFKSSLDLNVWGFILLQFFIFAAYTWCINYYKNVATILLILLGFLTLYSMSRTALSLLIISLIWWGGYINKFKYKTLLSFVIIFIITVMINRYFEIISFKLPDAATDFIKNKASTYQSDLVDVRFYLINIKPITEIFGKFNIIQFFIGDAKNIQHSWLSNSLLVTGIIGFILYIMRFCSAMMYAINNIKIAAIESKFLLLFMIILIINDFMTNSCLFVPFAGYISSIILAVFFAEIERKRSQYTFTKELNE